MIPTRRRRTSGWERAGDVTAIILIVGAVIAVEVWFAMLLFGGLHHTVAESVPALGYGPTALVIAALNFFAAYFRKR